MADQLDHPSYDPDSGQMAYPFSYTLLPQQSIRPKSYPCHPCPHAYAGFLKHLFCKQLYLRYYREECQDISIHMPEFRTYSSKPPPRAATSSASSVISTRLAYRWFRPKLDYINSTCLNTCTILVFSQSSLKICIHFYTCLLTKLFSLLFGNLLGTGNKVGTSNYIEVLF